MLTKLLLKLESKATLGNIFLAIFVQTFMQIILVLVMSPKLHQYSSGSMLDVRLMYSDRDILLYFTELGKSGRELYLFYEMIDIIYPVAYTAAFILLLSYLGKFAFHAVQITKVAIIGPLLLFVLDYFENGILISLLISFPEQNFLASLVGYITLSKYCMVVLNFTIVSIFGLIALKKELL